MSWKVSVGNCFMVMSGQIWILCSGPAHLTTTMACLLDIEILKIWDIEKNLSNYSLLLFCSPDMNNGSFSGWSLYRDISFWNFCTNYFGNGNWSPNIESPNLYFATEKNSSKNDHIHPAIFSKQQKKALCFDFWFHCISIFLLRMWITAGANDGL